MTSNIFDTYSINLCSDSLNLSLPREMNKCIPAGNKEWIIFNFDRDNDLINPEQLTTPASICFITESDDNSINTGVVSTEELLLNYDMTISQLLINRSLFIHTGCFNEFLGEGCIFEFLCRASLYTDIIYLGAQSKAVLNTDNTHDFSHDILETLAYVICCVHSNNSAFVNTQKVLNTLLSRLKNQRRFDIFMNFFNRFTLDPQLFNKYFRNTSPIYIISGDDTCMGVLNGFAGELAKTFAQMGQALITTDGKYIPYFGLEDIDGKTLKALIGFQAPILFDDFFIKYSSPKFQFWFDDPVYFGNMFYNLDDSVYILCQDAFHADYLNRVFEIENAFQMPPGGIWVNEPEYKKRDLDIVFIGTYVVPEEPVWDSDLKKEYYEYMLLNPSLSYEQGVSKLLQLKGISLSRNEYISLLQSFTDIYRYICEGFRSRIIDMITGNGIQLHVYGDSWKNYTGKNAHNLILHPLLSPDKMINELNRAKLSLNIMSWHKGGMTERVINSMLAGATCISDETLYFKEHLTHNEIVQYKLSKLELLPEIIFELLNDDEKRIKIAKNAYKYASHNETWNNRAYSLLDLMI